MEAEKALHNATKIKAKAALLEPFPDYSPLTSLNEESTTKQKKDGCTPHVIEEWEEFETLKNDLLAKVDASDLFVTRRVDIFEPETARLDCEVTVHDFMGSILRHTVALLRETLGLQELALDMGSRLPADFEGGLPDIAVRYRDRIVFVIELKRPRVRFKKGSSHYTVWRGRESI